MYGVAACTWRSAPSTCISAACARRWNRSTPRTWCRPCAAPATGSPVPPESRRARTPPLRVPAPATPLYPLFHSSEPPHLNDETAMPRHIRSAWLKTLATVAAVLLFAGLVGWFTGHLWLCIALGALATLAWHYWRLRSVLRRLTARQRWDTAEEGTGVWNELDRLL